MTSKITSSQRSILVLSTFAVTIGTSGIPISGEKTTTGPFPITSSLFVIHSLLSYNVTPNINSHGILGREKYAYGTDEGVIFSSRRLLGSSLR